MTRPPLIDYATAKEIASSVVKHESARLAGDDHYMILDSRSTEHPWGWGFNPVVEPYWSKKLVSPHDSAWSVTVDRFSGKVQLVGHTANGSDDRSIMDLTLHDVGHDRPAIFKLVRQLTKWSAAKAKAKLHSLPVVVTAGSMLTVRSIHEVFLSRGATTTVAPRDA